MVKNLWVFERVSFLVPTLLRLLTEEGEEPSGWTRTQSAHLADHGRERHGVSVGAMGMCGSRTVLRIVRVW